MKKVSLLAASVAIALSGCGGSDGGSSNGATPGGIVITGFDGYFKNAVVFDDVGQPGVLEVGTDTIFGLTDKDGKITLPTDTEIDGKLALKTLRPGDMTKALAEELSALSSKADSYSDFMDVYTTDMDHEGQPMANSVVFRTPEGTDKTALVISPITDLVAIEMQKNNSSFEDATATVNEDLGGSIEDPIDLFSDFVATSKDDLESAQLHKTAQILTESKAQDPTAYANNANSITETAVEASKEIVTEENMGSEELVNEKPVIDPSQPETAVPNYKLLVDSSVQATLEAEFNKLEIIEGQGFTHTITVPENLFQDKYSAEGEYQSIATARAKVNGEQEITVTLEGEILTISAKENFEPTLSSYIVTLTADDRATADSKVLSELSTTFSFDVSLVNTAPKVDPEAQSEIQREITNNWTMKQGEAFSAELSVSGLFTDCEDDTLTYDSNISSVVKGLTSKYDAKLGKLIISGHPETPTVDIKQFNITADDGHAATFMVSEPATFDLPVIAIGDIAVDTTVETELQKTITNTWSLKAGEPFSEQLDISELFTSNVSGDVEYYANYAAHDNEPASNPIPGVSVNVDASGLVTLEGTPTSETNGVILYVAKGINFSGGEENDIESEMVTFALPNAKPADITPPPEGDHPLINHTWYFLERGQSDGDGNESNDYSRVWCDTVRFEDGNVYYSNRTVENKTECTSEADELVGTYSIEGNSLVAAYAEDGDVFNITYDVTNDYDSNEISQGAVTLLQTEDGESSRYTWFKSEFDAEKRIQVASSDNSGVRDAAIYWPSSQEDKFKLISTTLQMDVANGSGNSHDYIKVWMNGISCDGLFEGQDGDEAIFDSFRVTFDDNYNGIYANSNSCFTAYEDGTPNAVISFLFGLGNNNRLELDETYSIMGKISDGPSNWSHYITDINFNMTWDGVSNDE